MITRENQGTADCVSDDEPRMLTRDQTTTTTSVTITVRGATGSILCNAWHMMAYGSHTPFSQGFMPAPRP